jgi:hypothetical protein
MISQFLRLRSRKKHLDASKIANLDHYVRSLFRAPSVESLNCHPEGSNFLPSIDSLIRISTNFKEISHYFHRYLHISAYFHTFWQLSASLLVIRTNIMQISENLQRFWQLLPAFSVCGPILGKFRLMSFVFEKYYSFSRNLDQF